MKTVAFVAPAVVLPDCVKAIKAGLDPLNLAKISQEDLEVWRTPEGTLYHNGELVGHSSLRLPLGLTSASVLASKNTKSVQRKGKDAAMEKWDAEMRSSLTSKKAHQEPLNLAKLSKQDRELVESTLRTESATRKRVQEVYDGALRALALLRSIIASKTEEFDVFIPDIVDLILNGVVRPGFPPDEAMEGFLVSFERTQALVV